MKPPNEQRYFDALKRISLYSSVEDLREHSEEEYGLDYEEALEMAYENIIWEAKSALGKNKRPS